MSTRDDEIRTRIDTALSEVGEAEKSLEGLLKAVLVAPRADKVTVTSVVEKAFERLRNAHTELARLRELIVGKD